MTIKSPFPYFGGKSRIAALAGRGDADKRAMLAAAAPHFDHDPLFLEIECRRGLWAAWMNDARIYDEHAADALGVALAAVERVVVEEAA